MPSANTFRPARHGLVYGRAPAGEFLTFLGPLSGTVLDVGPGEGGWADLLRAAGASRLVGVEPDPVAARVARSRYDTILEQPIEDVDATVLGEADLIIAADCLEHLLDPWKVLRRLHAGSRPGTLLAVSVPNLRYPGILGPALLQGRFEYSDVGGLMDRGHLRWFTHASLRRALTVSGWAPTRCGGAVGSGRRALLNRLSGDHLVELLTHQVYVVASRDVPG